jgi:hypothetical protein
MGGGGGMRNIYGIVFGRREEIKSLGKTRRRQKDNINLVSLVVTICTTCFNNQ